MKVLVDTSVWSLALRRAKEDNQQIALRFASLIRESRVAIIGPIRQEILSGIKTTEQYEKLKMHLRAFADIPLAYEEFEFAAELYNRCRKRGIQGSHTDFLLCSVSIRHQLSIFTLDNDFTFYAKHCPIQLFDS